MLELKNHPEVLTAMAAFTQQQSTLVDLCIQVQQIAAPTDDEAHQHLYAF